MLKLVNFFSKFPLKILILFSAFFIVALLVRVPFLLSTNLDEGIYLTVSDYVSRGFVLYKDIPENKPPLIFLINSFLIPVLGHNILSFRMLLTFLTAIVAVLLFYITDKISSPPAGLISGLIFSSFSSLPIYEIFWVRTESYLIFLEIVALYIFVLEPRTLCKYNYLILGLLIGCILLVRQTGLLFAFAILCTLLIRFSKRDLAVKEFLLFLSGVFVCIFITLAYFFFNNAFQDMLYWVIFEPFSFLRMTYESTNIFPLLKVLWFLDIVVVSLPLILLSTYGLKKFNLKGRARIYVIVLLVWLVALSGITLLSNLVPGYHHEYAEILIPLSLCSAIGIRALCVDLKKLKFYGLFIASLLLVSFFAFWYPLTLSRIDSYEYRTDDLTIVNNVSDFLKKNTSKNESVYVFETLWPKNSLNIYFTSERFPQLTRLFYFPNFITRNETVLLVDSLERAKTPYIVMIGPAPAFPEANNIYQYITTHYSPSLSLGSYSPFPWLKDQPIVIFKRMTPS